VSRIGGYELYRRGSCERGMIFVVRRVEREQFTAELWASSWKSTAAVSLCSRPGPWGARSWGAREQARLAKLTERFQANSTQNETSPSAESITMLTSLCNGQ